MLVPKLFTCFKSYSKEQFAKDLISGIIVAIIALPLSIALAIASGVSPEKGLYTAIIAGFLISLLGGSKVQIGGPTGAFIVIVYGIIQKFGIEGLTIATFMAGFFLILMGIFKCGNMIKYIPYPITTGFTSGIAVTIFSTQIKDFLGLNIDIPSEFMHKWIVYFQNLNSFNIQSLLIGVTSILIIILLPKINKKVPSTLVAIIFCTFATIYFNLNIDTIGSKFSNIPSTLPSITVPNLNINMIITLIPSAITIAILAGIESLLSAVVADGMVGGNHRSNMELVAQGLANIASALFGGIPATGAIARTAANIKNGGRTPISGIVHSITLILFMIILMPYIKLIPMASLSAILIVVSYNMGEWDVFKKIHKFPKSDSLVFLTVFLLTVFFDLVISICVGIVLSSFLFMKRMADVTDIRPVSYTYEDVDETAFEYKIQIPKDIYIYEINGAFFFGATDKFIKTMKSMNDLPKVLILKMSNVYAMDATAYNALEATQDLCDKNGIKLLILDIQYQPLKVLKKCGFINNKNQDILFKDFDSVFNEALNIVNSYYDKQKDIPQIPKIHTA
ncbi:MAG: sulfate permease [Tepidibacter sp.]|jgi:SulP family sulfate permease|uniref:SulP family inorganic anion transporter n=1 Tax=Tepidibacter sp. TaxID=2529387 RepID=UPI0025FE4E73|nr:sulfate permease [Tepidibacter sp.]MCT4508325.1 sulfate permease [Tepidibacter sp.]